MGFVSIESGHIIVVSNGKSAIAATISFIKLCNSKSVEHPLPLIEQLGLRDHNVRAVKRKPKSFKKLV